MGRTPAKFIFACLIFLTSYLPASAQGKYDQLFNELKADEKLVAECEQKIREYQLSKFGRVLPKIAGDCFGGCPIIVPKPYYGSEARRLKIRGQIKVEAIVDENGDVVYARIIKGLPMLNKSALAAAYRARYMPKKACNDKPIKFRWVITYNFLPN